MKNEKIKIGLGLGLGLGAVILATAYNDYIIRQYGKNIMKKEE